MVQRVTVQHVPGCPNLALVLDRLASAFARLDGPPPEVSTEEIADPDEASRTAFPGSPTVLVDGLDRFTSAGGGPAFACRTYRTAAGVEGAPSVEQLVAVLADITDSPPRLLGSCARRPGDPATRP